MKCSWSKFDLFLFCFLSLRRSESDRRRLKTKEASSMTWCYNCSISRLVCVVVYLKHGGAAGGEITAAPSTIYLHSVCSQLTRCT